jgi:uncharacterized cupin superfamily protein
MGITHFDQAPSRTYELGHLQARWTLLGEAAGSIGVGVRRIQILAGGWSTPVHDHGVSEELFYVLEGEGLLWHRGALARIGAGDCIVCRPRRGGHSLHALSQLDVLAFGPREYDESVRFERLGLSLVGGRMAETRPGAVDGVPLQFVKESEAGPPELIEPTDERPPTIANLADIAPVRVDRPRIARTRRNLGVAVGSVTTGLQHVEVEPGMLAAPLHCHSLEEELFVILGGDGVLLLEGDGTAGAGEETAVAAGHVVSRPSGTGVSHTFRAGPGGLTYLAYGTRDAGDVCYYPTSNKISWRGVGVIGRLDKLDLWDGED